MGEKVRFVLLGFEPFESFVNLLIIMFEFGQNDTRQLHYTQITSLVATLSYEPILPSPKLLWPIIYRSAYFLNTLAISLCG